MAEHSHRVRGRLLVGLSGMGIAGALTIGLGLACSAPSLPNNNPPPPSDAAAPWVGCYTCNTFITGIPTLDAGPVTATFTNGLSVSASANTLSGWIADLDSGTPECFLRATVTGNAGATLYIPGDAQPPICDIETHGELVAVQYMKGTFTLEGGVLTGQLAVSFPVPWCVDGGPPCNDAGLADGGAGTQMSSCTKLAVATCPWQ